MWQAAVLIAAIDRMHSGGASQASSDLTASELAAGWSPASLAEALVLFGKALALFHHGVHMRR